MLWGGGKKESWRLELDCRSVELEAQRDRERQRAAAGSRQPGMGMGHEYRTVQGGPRTRLTYLL